MKKYISFFLALILLLPALSLTAFAAETPTFRYEVTVDGKDTKEVQTGDIITVTLHLYRTDKDAPYTMYAMQDELRYDSTFFELVEDSALLASGVNSTDIALVDHHREFYMNFVSFSGGAEWKAKTRVGSFELKVIGTEGASTITNEDFLVSLKDGSGSYPCEANKLTVIVSSKCTVHFESNGGSKIDDVKVSFGEKLSRPKDPTREGKTFAGWFKDIHLTEEWDFKNDTVQGNMTLYAKWEDATTGGSSSTIIVVPGKDNPGTDDPTDDPSGKPTDPSTEPSEGDDPVVTPDDPSVNEPTDDPTQDPGDPSGDDPGSTPAGPGNEPSDGKGGWKLIVFLLLLLWLLLLLFLLRGKRTVKFDARGGSPVEKQKVAKGGLIDEPVDPAKPGAVFDGWYLDPELTLPWNFEESVVRKNMTLYAKWK